MNNSSVDPIATLVKQEGIRRIDLANVVPIEPEVLEIVPQALARRYKMVPYARSENAVMITTANPFDIGAEQAVEARTGLEPRLAYTPDHEIEVWLNKLYESTSSDLEDEEHDVDFEQDEEVETTEFSVDIGDEAEEDEALPIKIVNAMFKQAIQNHASDIHVEPREDAIRVRLRVDGVLREGASYNKSVQPGIISRIKIIAGLDIAERRVPQDGRIKLKVYERAVDLRVSTLPTIYGEKVVMRILDKERQSLSLKELGFEPDVLEEFIDCIEQPYGLILVTGPTGSGKTTTLYSALSHVNSPEQNLITVEDPVEFRLPGINQVQTKSEIGLTFAAGLRSILRQDPDVVMVGEIRDSETAEIAIRAALTGHLVFSTLHTNNSIDTIMRLVDMGIDKYLLCSALKLVIAQRLVRRVCIYCVEPCEVPTATLEKFNAKIDALEGFTYMRGAGCDNCGGSGFSGRIPIFEFFFLNNQLRDLILSGASIDKLREKALDMGMETLQMNGINRVKQGLTTLEEVLKVSYDN